MGRGRKLLTRKDQKRFHEDVALELPGRGWGEGKAL